MVLCEFLLISLIAMKTHAVEPSCPKYDLEDRVWERVIKQEIKISNTLKEFQENLNSKIMDELTKLKGMLYIFFNIPSFTTVIHLSRY